MAGSPRARLRVLASALGLIGGVVCSISMVLAAVASVGVAAAAVGGSMSGMSANDSHHNPVIALLIQWGPAILVASIALITIAVALRGSRTALAVLAAGGLLYWGIYLQASLPIMYLAIVSGLVVWAVVVAWPLLDSNSRDLPATPKRGSVH